MIDSCFLAPRMIAKAYETEAEPFIESDMVGT